MKKIINYANHYIDKQDIFEVNKVLKSNFLTQGPTVGEFENKIKKYLKVKFAVSVNSATSGLHLACLALGVKKTILSGLHQIHLLRLPIVLFIVEQKLILWILTLIHIISVQSF